MVHGHVQTFERHFEPDRQNVSHARKFAVEHTPAVGPDDTSDVVELLVSELVTNAILHAGTYFTLCMSYEDGLLRVEVRDTSNAKARLRRYDASAATGRGLVLIEALATEWGVETHPEGKTVWFTLRVEEPT